MFEEGVRVIGWILLAALAWGVAFFLGGHPLLVGLAVAVSVLCLWGLTRR